VALVDVRDNRVADDGQGKGEEHDYATELHTIGDDGDDHSADCCDGVGNDGPELDFVGRVAAECLNDGRQLK